MDRRVGRVAGGAQPIDGARKRELRRSEAVDEVAAPDLAALLEHLQHPVHAGESTGNAFGEHGLTRHHAVPLDELQRAGVRRLGRGRHRLAQRRHEAPSAGARGWSDANQPTRPRPPTRS